MTPHRKLYTLGTLQDLRPSQFRHSVVLEEQDKRHMKSHAVITCWQAPDYTDPLVEQVIGLAQQHCSEFHSSTSKDMGLIAGLGFVRPHRDTDETQWTALALLWVGGNSQTADLMVEDEYATLEAGDVVLFRTDKLHCWVCEKPWTALFVDWDDWRAL